MMTTLTSKGSRADRAPALARRGSVGSIATRLVERFLSWLDRVRQRRQLHALDDHMLKDIGVTRADVEAEVEKHFWMR